LTWILKAGSKKERKIKYISGRGNGPWRYKEAQMRMARH
jgi:hypothetical protein